MHPHSSLLPGKHNPPSVWTQTTTTHEQHRADALIYGETVHARARKPSAQSPLQLMAGLPRIQNLVAIGFGLLPLRRVSSRGSYFGRLLLVSCVRKPDPVVKLLLIKTEIPFSIKFTSNE